MDEQKAWKINGFLGMLITLLLIIAAGYAIYFNHILLAGLLIIVAVIALMGLTIIQPNQARVIILFGKYVGSIRTSGIWLTIPFTTRTKVSLKVRNFNTKQLKVNDVEGNPIEIANVVVFKVIDTAKAVFDVDDYEQFIEIQSETALRHVATKYPYDTFEQAGYSLRGNTEEIAEELQRELQTRLALAGVEVLESRLTHLAYATEIANAMLQRQQAMAIIAARQKIVEGAVGMVQMAIEQLQEGNVIELDEERKANMINNLMVAIVSDHGAQPMINTGNI